MQGTGAQLYACTKNAKGGLEWSFREPVAALLQDGKTIGRHFVGPTWEFADGTHVTGKPEAKAPGATVNDVPWLKIAIAEPAKSGPAGGATTILRIDTTGGAFTGACSKEGELHAEPVRRDLCVLEMRPSKAARRTSGRAASWRPVFGNRSHHKAEVLNADLGRHAAHSAGITSQAQKVTGDASLRIDLHGFPKGTKAQSQIGGQFETSTMCPGVAARMADQTG